GGTYTRSGSVFVAIAPGVFRPASQFTAAVDATVEKIKAVPPAVGFDEVLLPGEPEQRSRAGRLVEGISLPDNSWETLKQLASRYGVDVTSLVS
ncbi:MAG: Ldh family oxidoreductase, partial [Actinobacteria bacterium]|nr:Ldh family oxidoreductase [Actinomycetota bacterium]